MRRLPQSRISGHDGCLKCVADKEELEVPASKSKQNIGKAGTWPKWTRRLSNRYRRKSLPLATKLEKKDHTITVDMTSTDCSNFPFQGKENNPEHKKQHFWSHCDHELFKLRIGPDYKKHRQKAPSNRPLYRVFSVDVYRSDDVIDEFAPR